MATTPSTQVQTLLDNYAKAKAERAELRKAHLSKRAEVRTLESTIETLVNFGVINKSVLEDKDEDEAEGTDSE